MRSKFLVVYLILCSISLSGCSSLGDIFGYQTNLNIINPKYFDNRYYNANNRHIPYGNIAELNNIETNNTQIKDNSNNKLLQEINTTQVAQNNAMQQPTSQPLIIDDSKPDIQKSNNIFKDQQSLMYSSGQNSLKTLDNMIENTNQNFAPPTPNDMGIANDKTYNNVDDFIIKDKKPAYKKQPITVHKVSNPIKHTLENNTPKHKPTGIFEDVPLE